MEAGNNAKCLAELQNLTIRFSDKVQELFMPALESRLLEMADVAKNNEQQWRLLQLSRDLRRQKASLTLAFRKHLAEGFRLFQRGQLGGRDTSQEDMSRDLSLVANDELEQDLAASSMSRRAETRFSEELFTLNQRLAMLNGGKKLVDDGNPLGPSRFAAALQTEIDLLELDTRFTVLFFRIYEKILLENLGDLYKSANDYLIKQGVLPNLRFGVSAGSAKPKPKPEPAKSSQEATAQAEEKKEVKPAVAVQPDPSQVASNELQQQLYAAIRQLQGYPVVEAPTPSPSSAPAAAQAGTGFQPSYFSRPPVPSQAATAAHCTQGEVVSALHSVPLVHHAETIENANVPPPMTVEQYQGVTLQLREQIGDGKEIGDEGSRIIDLVGMIFEYMLGDKQLPDSVKAVLSYLHTPYLKAAFMDQKLFERPDHPSRQLLNCLADAGTRWVNNEGASQFKVFPKIKSIVRRILTEFHNDISLFDELLQEMLEFNQKVEHSIALMERRAREKAEGEDRLREVKRRVMTEVRKRMDGRELPAHIVVLLLHPWSDYLTFTLLRHGEDSPQWQEGVDTIGDIIWSIEAKADHNERNRLMMMQQSLQARVQAGLETIAHDQVKSNKLLDALAKSQMLALQNLSTEPAAPEKRAELEADAVVDIMQEPVDISALTVAERDMMDRLSHVDFGTWIEFDHLDDREKLRAKIAWFNAQTSRYMLVDRTGKQVAMKSGLEISRLILASQARMVVDSSKPFFERAFENIVTRLKSTMPH